MLALGVGGAAAQSSVDIGLLAPFSGPWAEHGKFMRIGAEMAVEEINKQGGIKALDGAKINLVVADTGPSVETATNAAQRLLSGGKLTAFTYPYASIGGKALRMSPGAKIYNEQNLIIMPAAMRQQAKVLYRLDNAGFLSAIWLLTEHEAAAFERRLHRGA